MGSGSCFHFGMETSSLADQVSLTGRPELVESPNLVKMVQSPPGSWTVDY